MSSERAFLPLSGTAVDDTYNDLQAGNQIGENFWKMLLAEHGLDNNGVRQSLPLAKSELIFRFLLTTLVEKTYHGTDPLQVARVSLFSSPTHFF